MKITDIRTAVIAANFPWNLIRVYTDSGLVGLGEAYWGPGVTDVVEKLKPRLVGEDPMEVDRLWTRMMRLMSGAGSIAGTTVAAISGIEIALLDLVGKHLKTPVYQLLGGKFRNRIRIYADSHAESLRDIDTWQERALQVRERGFRPLIEKGGCQINQTDIPRCDRLLESKRIADLADIYYIPFAAHNVCSPVGTVASAHVCAAICTFLVLEFHSQDIPWWDAVVAREQDPLIKSGYLTLSDKPGLGVELNDEVCRQHVQAGTLYFGEAV